MQWTFTKSFAVVQKDLEGPVEALGLGNMSKV